MGDMILLGQVAERLSVLEIACRHCERRGRLNVQRLVAQHGADMAMPVLLDVLAADCPRLHGGFYNRCGAHFPQLVGLFSDGAPSRSAGPPGTRF